MKYHHIKNSFFNSNTFIVIGKDSKAIIIDPGNPNIQPLLEVVKVNRWSIVGVMLTHEHADHIAGLEALIKIKQFTVFCSKECANNIKSSKNNLSKYIEEIDSFELSIPTQIVRDGEMRNIAEVDFSFYETPGHSPGGICIFTENAVFVGDTILNKEKVPLNFPHSNRIQYLRSIEKLKKLIKPGINVFPGHGKAFKFISPKDIYI